MRGVFPGRRRLVGIVLLSSSLDFISGHNLVKAIPQLVLLRYMPGDLLDGRVGVVTGGSSGIGRAIASRMAEEGADIVVADIRAEPRQGGEPTHQAIRRKTDSSAEYVACDVTNRSDLISAVEAAEEFGSLDIMVNNAGVISPEEFLVAQIDEYRRVMSVNAMGTYLGSQVAANRMVEGNGGSIINLSSVAGLAGTPVSVSYGASKGAVRLMTYAIAAQLGDRGIRANVIHPGTIETRMNIDDLGRDLKDDAVREQVRQNIASNRIGRPDDIANVAVFLASDMASYVNAESIIVDGGRHNTNLF